MSLSSRLCSVLVLVLGLHPGCSCQGLPIEGGEPGPTDPDGSGQPGDRPPLPGLTDLSVEPQAASLTVDDLAVPRTQAYRATGRFADGSQRDVTDQVNWRLDNSAIGTIDRAGVFTTSNQAGGRGTITAASGARSASATIDVSFRPTVRSPDAPADAERLLPPGAAGMQQAGRSPVIVYPSNRTLFPRNIYKVLFQWDTGTGNDLFRLEFRSDHLLMSVYTSRDRWEPTAAQWAWMASTNAGGEVRWTVYGISRTNPAQVWRSEPIVLGFSRNAVEGAIYYWSTTVAGVRRATVSDAAPSNFFTPQQTGKCVACHTLSRNGARLAADVGGHNLAVVEVKKIDPPVISWTQGIPAFWTTFNPDATRLVTANRGVLTLRDGDTGQALGTVPVGNGRFGTQPDWSPDGKLLAFTHSSRDRDRGVSAGSIATIEYAGGVWQNLKVIVPAADGNQSNYYPTFSPDSKWIAFVRAQGSSDNNLTARLFIVSADGTQGPVELAAANTVVNNQTLSGTLAQLGNSMPTWAPTRPGETAFLAFSSERAYGKVYRYREVEQLWVAAVDLGALPRADGSFPAFRLPFQDLMENNHRPFWAVDVLNPPPPPGDGGAPPDGGQCLPRGTDCRSGMPCCPPFICIPVGENSYTCEPLG